MSQQPSTYYSLLIRSMWAVFGVGLASVIIYLFFVQTNFLFLFGSLPGTDKLENPPE